MSVRILTGDCREVLATLPAGSVHCVVTAPSCRGLRDDGIGRNPGYVAMARASSAADAPLRIRPQAAE